MAFSYNSNDRADISSFLAQGAIIFGDIQELLDQQFNRLSKLEQRIMLWLAINREPVAIAELRSDLLYPVPTELLDALDSLQRRSLIEKSASLFTLQPVLMEYVTHRFIKQICLEIGNPSHSASIDHFKQYALIKAQSKDYVKETQISLILKPIVNQLLRLFGNAKAVGKRLLDIFPSLRHTLSGYAGGNVINMLRQFKLDLSGYDFSDLIIWQADLKNIYLRQTNFSGSDLAKTSFTESFNHIYSMAISPSGEWLATADTQGEICLWRLSDHQLLRRWEAHAGSVRSLTFTTDSRTIASGGDDQFLKLWDVQTGQCDRILHIPDGTVWAISVSPDGETIALTDGTVKLWNLTTDESLLLCPHVEWLTTMRFSLDGQVLALACNNGTIKLWHL